MADDADRILGVLTSYHHHALEHQQRWAWTRQIPILRDALDPICGGHIFLEFYIPRMGKRADAVCVIGGIIFVIEFKTGAVEHSSTAFDQVFDYALDLKNFHEGSHNLPIVPLLVSENAAPCELPSVAFGEDLVANPIPTNAAGLAHTFDRIISDQRFSEFNVSDWSKKGYRPTPTIIEAARVLYETHSVTDISRSDAGAKNLRETTESVGRIIDRARELRKKAICFVTGVPGSGKTLAGLNFATRRAEEYQDEHAVFLSGNGPLVAVLREALARDTAIRKSIPKKNAERQVHSFIQNIHHFRDEYVGNSEIPLEKVVIFDEAQRAWTRTQAAYFMRRERGQTDFDMSEPEFLISVMDRHSDWCAVVCLVGEGQEINTGEAGISEWLTALETRFPKWDVHISPRITSDQSISSPKTDSLVWSRHLYIDEHLHLAMSMRSFRAEALSDMVGALMENDLGTARGFYKQIRETYPIVLTRNLDAARRWLRASARGTERTGLMTSSGALRLRPEGIHVKAKIDPPIWFLNDKTDVRSSYYLEEVATEFDIQGLELDWAGVCWDGDFHHNGSEWGFRSFRGTNWESMKDVSRQSFRKNAYRVLLTRARQGMVIFVPRGSLSDSTRPPSFYDETFEFLRRCGFSMIE